MRQRWVEWYRHLYNLELFKLHEIESNNNNSTSIPRACSNPNLSTGTKLRLSQMLCDQLEDLSEDSDSERDTKYNFLDEADVIEEEAECAEDDEDDECDDFELDL